MSYSVEFASLRSNLVNLPHSVASSIFSINVAAQQVIVELERVNPKPSSTPPKKIYLGWTGLYSSDENSIEMDPAVAAGLGVSHAEKVKLKINTNAHVAHAVHLEPASTEDWLVVENSAVFLENYMINQLRGVALGQTIVVFPSPTLLASLKITKIEPHTDSVAFLGPNSEVIVAPKLPKPAEPATTESPVTADSSPVQKGNVQPLITRCTVHPYVPRCNSRTLEIRGVLPLPPDSHVLVSLAGPNVPPANSEEQEVVRARNILATYINDPEITSVAGISYGLSQALGLIGDTGIGIKLLVQPLKKPILSSLPRMIVRPFVFTTNSKSLTSKPVHLTPEEMQKLGLVHGCKGLVLPPVDESFLPNGGILDSESSETAWGVLKDVVKGSETPLAESKAMDYVVDSEHTLSDDRPVVGQNKICDSIISALIGGTGVLLHGSRGCGKTVVINEVLKKIKQHHIRTIHFKCGNYTDKALPTVREALRKCSHEALWSAPAVVVFDDIDKMIPNQQEHSGDSSRQKQLAEVFYRIWQPIVAAERVSVLATAQDQSSIHQYLLTSHLLEVVTKLKSPNKVLREEILRTAIEHAGFEISPELDLLEVVDETEGYQPGDLWILMDRVSTNLALADTMKLTTKCFTDATADYVPASLRGVKLEKPTTKWQDVGGLREVKRVVLETLDWPTKYAPIFANSPLRPRSGLLFYGYPGCGKTMLAGAIASQTGLNFISVKGPELLNKYIGASEQSVRDLFDRAQAAKPCVLFFDEFDSIAPKRGHDSTGVTDRVVNQLLTQMDGAEGLDGVYVLAATSRPDMIDSALLRPGRLDKTLLCDMPNAEDRYDIIMRATRKMNLEEAIDLHEVAASTNGFTGADLQALVYNAYLGAVHESLEKSEQEKKHSVASGDKNSRTQPAFQIGKGDIESAIMYASSASQNKIQPSSLDVSETGIATNILVTKEHMVSSLEVSKPSISAKEVAKFRAIYSEFCTDRNGEMPPGTSSNEIGGRVTLQ